MFDIVLVCRRPRQLPPMRVHIFTPSNLGASQSFSRKITKRYLLKLIILIITVITYYHSMLRRPDSKRRVDYIRGYPSDHNKIWLFFFVIIRHRLFSSLTLILFWSAGDQDSFCRCVSKSSFQTWRQSIILSKVKSHAPVFR